MPTIATSWRGQSAAARNIVTDNLADFPAEMLGRFGIEAVDTDEFLSRTFDLYPSEAMDVLSVLREAYNNPSFTPPEFIHDLTAKGLPRLAARAAERRNEL